MAKQKNSAVLNKDIPLWLKWTVAVVSVVGVVPTIWWFVLRDVPDSISLNAIVAEAPEVSRSDKLLANIINVAAVLTKADMLDTILEKQDFLKKYDGSVIRGTGTVAEVSRWGDGFLLDVNIARYLLSCRLNGGVENERRLPLLKGKVVDFSGTFTLKNIFGHGLSVDDCNLL